MASNSTSAEYSARILRVLEHIQGHLDSALAPQDLARVAHFSPYHFQRLFRAMVGESVMGHLRRLRLERAAARLKYTENSVTDIAFEAGYEVHEAFTRAFRRHFEVSPSEFRRRERPLQFPSAPSRVHYDSGGLTQFKPMQEPSKMTVSIQARPAMSVAYVHHIGPYEQCSEAWGTLLEWAAEQGELAKSPSMLGICYDDPDITDGANVRYDACLTLEDFEPEGKIGKKRLPAGDYAVVRHRGPYSGLGDVYRELFGQWLPASGREPANAPCLEQYWNDPEGTEPDELETDILLPLAPLETR